MADINNSQNLQIGELSGKIEVGFKNINERLDHIDMRLLSIEKNNTTLKLQAQENSINIENLEEKFNNHVTSNKEMKKEKNKKFYSKVQIILAIIGLISSGWWIKFIIDVLIRR